MRNARLFFLLLPLAVVVARAETDAKASERFSVLGLAFNGEYQYPSDELRVLRGRKTNIRGVSLSLFHEDRKSVWGLSVGLGYPFFYDFDRLASIEDMAGIQLALLGGRTEKLNGIQIAGLTVENDGGFNGVTFAGLANISGFGHESTSCGLQIALLGNVAVDIKGVQIALLNGTGELRGLQIGAVNFAEKTLGLQIGLANFSEEGFGLQIGLFNLFGKKDDRRILPLVNWRF